MDMTSQTNSGKSRPAGLWSQDQHSPGEALAASSKTTFGVFYLSSQRERQQQQQQQRQEERQASSQPSRAGYYQNTFASYEKPAPDPSTSPGPSNKLSELGSSLSTFWKKRWVSAGQHVQEEESSAGDQGGRTMPGSGSGGDFRGGSQVHQPTTSYPSHMSALDLDPGAMMTLPTIVEPDSGQANADTPASRPHQKSALHKAKALKENLLVRKLTTLLQDNRVDSGDMQAKLRDMNRSQEASNPILKRILNVIFITIGVALLLAVLIVIIYTTIAPENDEASSDRKRRSIREVKQDQHETKEKATSTASTPTTAQTTAYVYDDDDGDILVAVSPRELTSEARQRPNTEGDDGDEPSLRGEHERVAYGDLGALHEASSTSSSTSSTTSSTIPTTSTRIPKRKPKKGQKKRHERRRNRNRNS